MSEQNKTMVQRYFDDMLNKNNFDLVAEFLAADFTMVDAAVPMPIVGHTGFAMLQSVVYGGFPDMQFKVQEIIAEGDRVVTLSNVTGTNTGNFGGIPATGKHCSLTTMHRFQFENGKIVNIHNETNMAVVLQQLGILPSN